MSAAGRAFATALSVATLGVTTRALAVTGGVGAFGTYAAVFAFLAVVAVVADGGLYLVFTRAAATESAREVKLLKTILVLRLYTLLAVLGFLAAVVSFLHYPAVVRQGILLGALGVAAQLVTQITLGVFQKRLRMVPPAVGEIAGRAVTFLLTILFAALRGGILLFVSAFVLGSLTTLVWNVLAVRRLLPPPESFRRPLGRLDGGRAQSLSFLLREAWPLGLLLIFWMIVFRADSVLLFYLRPPEDLGWYALPHKILESLLFFPAMIGGLLLPSLSQSAAAQDGTAKFQILVGEATNLFLLLAFPAVIFLILFAPFVIHVLGGDAFAPAVPVLRILAVALGALFFGNLYGNGAVALGAQRPLLKAAILLAAANVAVNLIVIPRYSFLGSAWTKLGTELLSAVAAGAIVVRRTGSFMVSPQSFHVLSAGGLLILVTFLPIPAVPRAFLGLLVYVAALFCLRVLTPAGLRALLKSQRAL